MKRFRYFLFKTWCCKLWKWHDWTCACEQGIKPPKEINEASFYEYAKMYCKRCGFVYPLSQKLIDDAKIRN